MTEKTNLIHTDVIDNAAGFDSIKEEWDDLLTESEEENPFLSHQWLQTWWEVYGHGSLHIIVAWNSNSGELIGILPLFRYRRKSLIPARMLKFLGSERVSSDFLGCLARRGSEEIVYQACMAALQRDANLWDIVEFQDMDEDSLFFSHLIKANIQRIVIQRDPDKCCPFLALPESWEALLKNLSSKMRQRVGYYRRALAKKWTVQLEQLTSPDDVAQAMSDMVRLRQDRMDQKGIVAGKVTQSYFKFHEILMPRLLACDKLRLYFLRVDNQRVAYMYLFAGGKRIYFYQTGFDRNWSNQSIGFVLLGKVIEKTVNEGFTTFEFLRGDERYKYEWGNVDDRHLCSVTIFSTKPYGLICQFLTKSLNKIYDIKRYVSAKYKERN